MIHRICRIAGLVFYLYFLYWLWHLCQYGGLRNHLYGLVISGLGFILILAVRILTERRYARKAKQGGPKWFWIETVTLLVMTVYFGGRVVYSAIPYNGALSWKIDEWRNQKEITLVHQNVFEDGVDGILTDLDKALDLPDELYISNPFEITFDKNGTIQSISAFIYGKNEEERKKTYLIHYNADNSDKMTVWIDGNTTGQYEDDMLLKPMSELLSQAEWVDQVQHWSESNENETLYELQYQGKRSFHSAEGLRYVQMEEDEISTETWEYDIRQLSNGGEVAGFEVSLSALGSENITPVHYISMPEYSSRDQIQYEKTQEQISHSKDTSGWTVDKSDGTMYFFLNDQQGWRLVVTDAAAGSRFYVMEETSNGGTAWQRINEDPFGGQIGVSEGMIFFDEDFGYIGLTTASQSDSSLYVTRDGGITFESVELPMDEVTELPDIALESGYTIEDYDYIKMPERDGAVFCITVLTESVDRDGIMFLSSDEGVTWQYAEMENNRRIKELNLAEETAWYRDLPTASTAEELFGTHQFATERNTEIILSENEITFEELIVSENSVSIPYQGRSAFVDIIAKIDDHTYADVTSVVDWHSEDNEVAHAYDGRITAKGQGNTTVKASLAGMDVVIGVTVESVK